MTRSDPDLVPRDGVWGIVIQVELVVYAAATVYYIWQAIETLRPRGKLGRTADAVAPGVTPGVSARVLFHSDIVTNHATNIAGCGTTSASTT